MEVNGRALAVGEPAKSPVASAIPLTRASCSGSDASGIEEHPVFPVKRIAINHDEVGLQFRDGEFRSLLATGVYWLYDPFDKLQVDIVSQREPSLVHDKLDVIVKSGALDSKAVVVDLQQSQRGLVWINGRFSHTLHQGLYAYWTRFADVRVEVIESRKPQPEHPRLVLLA